jgi:hypothetical protein
LMRCRFGNAGTLVLGSVMGIVWKTRPLQPAQRRSWQGCHDAAPM